MWRRKLSRHCRRMHKPQFCLSGNRPVSLRKCRLRMRRECRERFIRHRLQRKPLVSDPGWHHVPWCMSGSLNHTGGENVPGIPGTCTTLNFTYLVRGPWDAVRQYYVNWRVDGMFPYKKLVLWRVHIVMPRNTSVYVICIDINASINDLWSTELQAYNNYIPNVKYLEHKQIIVQTSENNKYVWMQEGLNMIIDIL